VQGRWVPPLVALDAVLVSVAAGLWADPWIGLIGAAAVLVAAAVLAVVAQAVILVVARVSPWRRLLADVTPAYVASLTLRHCQLNGRPAWYAANYTPGRAGTGRGLSSNAAGSCAKRDAGGGSVTN
jgi:hypothetical protein